MPKKPAPKPLIGPKPPITPPKPPGFVKPPALPAQPRQSPFPKPPRLMQPQSPFPAQPKVNTPYGVVKRPLFEIMGAKKYLMPSTGKVRGTPTLAAMLSRLHPIDVLPDDNGAASGGSDFGEDLFPWMNDGGGGGGDYTPTWYTNLFNLNVNR